ncbi:MAG TPA: methyltransferase domain-containing protein [Polyangia bacterium]|nr:methyltransferase domain-containing protein [Polyangia bacterium]
MERTEPLLPSLAVLTRRLDEARAARMEALLADHTMEVREVAAACHALGQETRPPEADLQIIDRVAERLLNALRQGTAAEGPWLRRLHDLDERVRSQELEILDRDDVPDGLKRFAMRTLDWLNFGLGAYPLWAHAVRRALGPRTTAHVYDLAAGTGGFMRYLAKHPPAGYHLRLTSSDLRPDYVALGAAAASEGRVHFDVRDATDLRGLADVDLFVCTQATHHLTPGQVVRALAQAVTFAPCGILIIDVHRSLAVALAASIGTAMVLPFPLLILDGFQSVRRGYTPGELALLARLAGARRIDAHPWGAAYAVLHARA